MKFPIFADPSLNDVANSWDSLNNHQLNLENNSPARSWKIEDFNVQPLHSLKLTAKNPHAKREFIFQLSIFRGEELLVLGSVHPCKFRDH